MPGKENISVHVVIYHYRTYSACTPPETPALDRASTMHSMLFISIHLHICPYAVAILIYLYIYLSVCLSIFFLRFWYGGTEGNRNRFETKEECDEVCVDPVGKQVC